MAVFAKTRGNENGVAGEFFGRDIQFLKVTVAGAGKAAIATLTGPDCALATIVKATQMYATVSIVGTPTGDDTILAVEGLSNIGSVANLKATADAALVAAGFTAGTAITTTFVVHEVLKPTF